MIFFAVPSQDDVGNVFCYFEPIFRARKNPSHSIVSVCRSIKPTNKLRKSVILHSDYHNNYIVICVSHTVVSKRLRPNPSIHVAAGTLIFYNWISTVTMSREQYIYLVTRSDDDNNASR